jgi:hypothetical protein
MPAHPTGLYMEASSATFSISIWQFEGSPPSERLVARSAFREENSWQLHREHSTARTDPRTHHQRPTLFFPFGCSCPNVGTAGG